MSLERFNPGAIPVGVERVDDRDIARRVVDRSVEVADFLKALSHEGRLMILCHLAGGERSVTELEALLGQRQAAVSQQLARLRLEGMVATRREGKAIYYSIQDTRVLQLLRRLPDLFARAV